MREVSADHPPDVALANHLVMGPVILARALGGEVPYAVKVHGSALEYTVRPNRERFLPYAREGLEHAGGVLVGSRHTAESLWEVVDMDGLRERTRLGPPGVDTSSFRPRPAGEAAAALDSLAERLEGAEAASWGGDAGAADALRRLDPVEDEIVSYVGKLIVSKGVDLLLAAWPLVHRREPRAEPGDRRVRRVPRRGFMTWPTRCAAATSTRRATSPTAAASSRAASAASSPT